MLIAKPRQIRIRGKAIRPHKGALSHVFGDERKQTAGMPVFNHAKPKPSSINKRLEWHPSFMGLAMFGDTLLGIFACPHLDRSNDRRHVMGCAAFAPSSTTVSTHVYFEQSAPHA